MLQAAMYWLATRDNPRMANHGKHVLMQVLTEANRCRYAVLRTKPTGVVVYECRTCGHKRCSRTPADLLWRLCPELSAEETTDTEEEFRQAIEAELRTAVEEGRADRTWEAIAADLARCYQCARHKGRVCTRSGWTCKRREHWIIHLLLNDTEDCYAPST